MSQVYTVKFGNDSLRKKEKTQVTHNGQFTWSENIKLKGENEREK